MFLFIRTNIPNIYNYFSSAIFRLVRRAFHIKASLCMNGSLLSFLSDFFSRFYFLRSFLHSIQLCFPTYETLFFLFSRRFLFFLFFHSFSLIFYSEYNRSESMYEFHSYACTRRRKKGLDNTRFIRLFYVLSFLFQSMYEMRAQA